MKIKIGVNEAEFYAYHGFYPEENTMGHLFIVDVQVTYRHKAIDSDELTHTINYETLYTICREEMESTQKLLETVVFKIGSRIKALSKAIKTIKICVRKKGVQLGGKVESTFVAVKM